MSDHEAIYLEPKQDDPNNYNIEGRQWCQDNVWPTDPVEDERSGVKYIRADIVEELRENKNQVINVFEQQNADMLKALEEADKLISQDIVDGTASPNSFIIAKLIDNAIAKARGEEQND